MREIKFRVWDNDDKKWMHDKGFTTISFNREGAFFPYGTGNANSEWPGRFVVQMYTELKDKNGVDIYEGDILKCKGYDGWFDTTGYFYNTIVEHRVVKSGNSHISGFVYIPEECEVIGNVFENWDLV